jgi:secreted PhoX family phosphatase
MIPKSGYRFSDKIMLNRKCSRGRKHGLRKEKAMKHGDKATLGRREFLRTIGAGAGLAATAAVPLATNAAATQADAEKNKTRYQETDHVKTFYRVNGYPKS